MEERNKASRSTICMHFKHENFVQKFVQKPLDIKANENIFRRMVGHRYLRSLLDSLTVHHHLPIADVGHNLHRRLDQPFRYRMHCFLRLISRLARSSLRHDFIVAERLHTPAFTARPTC